jgi:DNA-binding NarL/FixJ family response regulator
MNRIRVLLADDHAVARAGMRTLLDTPELELVGEARDGTEALRHALDLSPDVAILDFNMPGLTGADVAARLRDEAPTVHVLVLSAHEDRAFLKKALEAGAKGYVLKRAAAEELLKAVRVVAGGGVYLDPALAGHVVAGYVGPELPPGANGQALSERETEVLRLISRGFVNKEVAAQLDVSVKTVETYKLRAMEKLGFRSRVDVVRYAHRQGWLDES